MHLRLVAPLVALTVACGANDEDPEPADDGDDLTSICGDGVVQDDEECDGNCRTSCGDEPCYNHVLEGTPDECNVRCVYTIVSACIDTDECCGSGCTGDNDLQCDGVRLDIRYEGNYILRDLGAPPGVPARLGGVVMNPDDPSKLWIGGYANDADGGLYEIGIVRDTSNRIIGFEGTATRIMDAAYNDGGIIIGPSGVLFLARWPENELSMVKTGIAPKVVDMGALGVAYSAASLLYVPEGYPGHNPARLKMVAWPEGQWYTLALTDDGNGLFDIGSATLNTTLPGGPEGVVVVPLGSAHFPDPAILVSNYDEGTVTTYRLDASGNPIASSRRLFVIGLTGAEGATIDPTGGDFIFTTFGGGDRIVVVHGFKPVVPGQ
jgi:hypothetical protein